MNTLTMFPATLPTADHFNGEWRAVARVGECDRSAVDRMIRQEHYKRSWPGVVVCTFALSVGNEVMGTCVFALPNQQTATRYGGLVWELARLWIDDRLPTNSETWFVGEALRHIKRTYRDVVGVVSYADPDQGHEGVIYKAANFTYDGMSGGSAYFMQFGRKQSRHGRLDKSQPYEETSESCKHRYYYPLRKRSA